MARDRADFFADTMEHVSYAIAKPSAEAIISKLKLLGSAGRMQVLFGTPEMRSAMNGLIDTIEASRAADSDDQDALDNYKRALDAFTRAYSAVADRDGIPQDEPASAPADHSPSHRPTPPPPPG